MGGTRQSLRCERSCVQHRKEFSQSYTSHL